MVFRVTCACGTEAALEAALIGKLFHCPGCRSRWVPVWGIDSKTGKVTPTRFEEDSRSPGGYKIPLGMVELPCPCGQVFFTRARYAGKRVECPGCATWLKVERRKDPQTQETRIRVVKSRLNQLPGLSPEPAHSAATNVQEILCSCGESLRVDPAAGTTQARCPACTTQIRIEIQKDSETTCTVIGREPVKKEQPSEKRGIDEDLSLDDFR